MVASGKRRPVVAFSLPVELIEEVSRIAADRGVKRSRLVEEMIRAYLGLD